MFPNDRGSETANRSRAAPAITAFIAFAGGIIGDRWLDLPLTSWIGLALSAWLGWLVTFNLRRLSTAAFALMLCIGFLGGAHHHLFWSTGDADDISLFARNDRRLIRLTGTVHTEPEIIPGQPLTSLSVLPPQERLVCTLRTESIATDDDEIPVNGLVRFEISGAYPQLAIGDRIRVLGWITKPTERRNPGGFDYAHYLRSRMIRAVVTTDHPETVHSTAGKAWIDLPGKLRSRLRESYRELFQRTLSPRTAPVAQSLFLGDRTSLPFDVQQAFRVTGSMHILAISGLHLAILGLLIWGCARIIKLSTSNSAMVLLAIVWGYAALTNGQASVMRACILTTVFAISIWKGKHVNSANSWGLSAFIVLLRNPLELFDIGAQLSFLAVAGMILCGPLALRIMQPAEPHLMNLERTSVLRRSWTQAIRLIAASYLVSTVVWSVTTPLILGTFHIISPVGLLLGVPLNPLVVLTLWAGYLLLIFGLVIPWGGVLFGTALDWGISALMAVVDGASQVQAGHFYAPGPGWIWLCVFYALLAQFVWSPIRRFKLKWVLYSFGLWISTGLAGGWMASSEEKLRCTFLSVGHGCAILIDLPNGGHVLYDAGSLHDGRRASYAVLSALCERHHPRIDLILLSHTDVDHYNALPELLRTIPVGQIACPQEFVDFAQPGIEEICSSAREEGIPIKLLQRGDRLMIDPDVTLEVLHPAGTMEWDSDNASSLVLGIEYAGRRILLTGDIADRGLDELLEQKSWPCDVMLSPHHGSLAANSTALATWAQPEYVIVSHGHHDTTRKLRDIYGDRAAIHSTLKQGAVTALIARDGSLNVSNTLNARE
ncbi:MAG: ComEC/Rec2 family competence protein [Planctomycetaceae bacterium]